MGSLFMFGHGEIHISKFRLINLQRIPHEERLRPLNIHFTPFVCNSVGCFGASTKPLLNKIATLYAAKTGSTFTSAVHTLMQQISFGAQYQQANNIILATSTAEFHREDLMVNYSYGLDL